MNKSITEIDGEIIVVSQFTLHAKTKKGNRPSYIKAARPKQAIPLYERFKEDLSIAIFKEVKSGEFAADMKVFLTNDGPVTLIIDSRNRDL
jgi:D-tyrosyl-tRNA(Tyr) deacylase